MKKTMYLLAFLIFAITAILVTARVPSESIGPLHYGMAITPVYITTESASGLAKNSVSIRKSRRSHQDPQRTYRLNYNVHTRNYP